MKVILLVVLVSAAVVGLKVEQLADTGSSKAARRAAIHLKRRLEEGRDVTGEEGAVRRITDSFSLQLRDKGLLPCSVHSLGVLQNAPRASNVPGCRTDGGAAGAMFQNPGQAGRTWPSLFAQGPGKEPTGLSAARAARVSALTSVPHDFDWQTYLVYHPELCSLGVDSDKLAREHYVQQGRAEVLILSCCGIFCFGPGDSVSKQPASSQLLQHRIALHCTCLLAALSWPC